MKRKIFIYAYPIYEYASIFLFDDDYLKEKGRENPFKVLNECIEKRYREKGYEIVYILYPDKDLYGIEEKNGDKIIYTDVRFTDASGYKEDGSEKDISEIIYPNLHYIYNQIVLNNIDNIVVGGYHFSDCVRKIAEFAHENNISSLVDLDLTDLFFTMYHRQDYFKVDGYDPTRYAKERLSEFYDWELKEFLDDFIELYKSPVYGISKEKCYELRKQILQH